MDWLARSPNLNPIEHVWDFLGRRLAARTLPPRDILDRSPDELTPKRKLDASGASEINRLYPESKKKGEEKCDIGIHPHFDRLLTSHCSATRGLLATDHVILNHGQVTWTTPELAPPLLTTTPHQRQDVSALDRFNVHRCPTRRVFSGTGLEPVTKQATVRYLYHSATARPPPRRRRLEEGETERERNRIDGITDPSSREAAYI
ncbi:uncharacterized protein TNCV_1946301 [Trichonephila clavipes]|uniref:Uncharacterized protein n=1 Tax=Trichonephila clavipes TaxID=2585209 RepID=A0A8X6VL19_TRICX|nr:uncharacterized protein TNCV_1946301 [Trichonephila clavipes]